MIAIRQYRISKAEILGASIAAVGLSAVAYTVLMAPPKLQELRSGWSELTDDAAELLDQRQNDRSIFGVELPRFELPQFNLDAPSIPQQKRIVGWDWQIQEMPCRTIDPDSRMSNGYPGDHWNGATGMYHCVVPIYQ